jgi:cytochrome P450
MVVELEPAQQRRFAVRRAKAASRARRWLLGLLLRLPGTRGSDPGALLARFPDEALLPFRRTGLDPVPELGRIRDREPVSKLKMPFGFRGWLVTGYAETRAILAADAKTFSNDFGHMIGKVGIAAEDDPGGLGFADPPAHTRLRKMLAAQFTARALAAREPQIRVAIDDALDEVEASVSPDGLVDLQEHFALAVPSRVIMELLGVDAADRAEFQRLSAARFEYRDGVNASFDTIQESIKLLEHVVARQRVEPRPGLISDILREHGDSVSDVELAGLADGVLTGGLETTVSMLSLGSVVLLQDRAMFERLRTEDSYAMPFVDELLRYLTVVQVGFPRFVAKDVVVGGKAMFAGDVVVCSLSGANRDPRHGQEMDRVDPCRRQAGHLAFGHGMHRCVGAELARLELRMAYPALARRFPNLRLGVGPDQLKYRDVAFVYGLEELPVRIG